LIVEGLKKTSKISLIVNEHSGWFGCVLIILHCYVSLAFMNLSLLYLCVHEQKLQASMLCIILMLQ
jgi:hypothetical protein